MAVFLENCSTRKVLSTVMLKTSTEISTKIALKPYLLPPFVSECIMLATTYSSEQNFPRKTKNVVGTFPKRL